MSVGGGIDLMATFARHRLMISSRLMAMNSWSMTRPTADGTSELSCQDVPNGTGAVATVCLMEQRVRHDLSYAWFMKPQQVKLALAAVWMLLTVVIIAASGYIKSTSDVLMLAAVAMAPPAAMWFWWNDPEIGRAHV